MGLFDDLASGKTNALDIGGMDDGEAIDPAAEAAPIAVAVAEAAPAVEVEAQAGSITPPVGGANNDADDEESQRQARAKQLGLGRLPIDAAQVDTAETGSIGQAPGQSPAPPGVDNLPDFLKSMYRRADYPAKGHTSWYLAPADKQAAFVERDSALHFENSKDANALRAGLMLARERGWVPATLAGTPGFCRKAFLEACQLGIPTTGYKPTQEDLAHLKTLGAAIPALSAAAAPTPGQKAPAVAI